VAKVVADRVVLAELPIMAEQTEEPTLAVELVGNVETPVLVFLVALVWLLFAIKVLKEVPAVP
jgi:hypothetical protein